MKKSREKRSAVWSYDHDMLQQLLDSCLTMVDIQKQLGINPYNGAGKTIHQRLIKSGEFDLTTFEKNRKEYNIIRAGKLSKAATVAPDLSVESRSDRGKIKKHLIKEGLIPYKCAECKTPPMHNNKILSLQLEHKNGVNNDNRLENLCFLCPNCHSQTDTYAGKKLKKDIIYETTDHRKARCDGMRVFKVELDELKSMIQTMPMTKIGKHFGVSDNAIRKRCILLDIELPKKKKRRVNSTL